MSVKSKARLQVLVIEAWDDLLEVTRGTGAIEWLGRALDASTDVEREHRRFMGRGVYDLSVVLSARYHVSRICSEYIDPPSNWTTFAVYRRDFALCMAVVEALHALGRHYTTSPEFKDIDYAGDIARR